MYKTDAGLRYSASDLISFLTNLDIGWLDRYDLERPGELVRDEGTEEDQLIRDAGDEHEQRSLADLRGRHSSLQWLMWQMGGLGPMAGQNGHFLLYAPEKIPYALERYSKEVNRLYGVLDAQLARTGHYVAGDEYTIADMAIFPWIRTHKAQQIALAEFPHVERWYNILFERPAAKRGLELGKELRLPKMDDEARKALFGQTARSVRTGAHKFG